MRDREEPKPTLKCQNIDSKNLEKKIGEKLVKFEKEIFISKKSYCLGGSHVIGKFENVNDFIKTSGATEDSAIYQG